VKVISVKRVRVDEFITLLLKHVQEEGFLQVRYYGLYTMRKKGVVGEIFERIQKFKKFKESLEPYISRRKCRKCGGE
jgi:ferritin-like protein